MSNIAAIAGANNGFSAPALINPSADIAVAENQEDNLSVMTWAYIIFRDALADLSSKGQGVVDKIEGKTAAMNQLEAARQTLRDWNNLVVGDQLQIEKTDEIILAGVKIPETSFSRCAYKLDPNDAEIKYSPFPPKSDQDYEKNHTNPSVGELIYITRENVYRVYTGTANVDVYSPNPAKTVPGPDVDFSAEEVGTIILVKSSNLYYRVASDGSGVPVTDYPLQKFIATLSDKGATDLDRALESKVTAVRDLSKKDLLDVQEFTSLLQVLSTFAIGLVSAFTSAANNVVRNFN